MISAEAPVLFAKVSCNPTTRWQCSPLVQQWFESVVDSQACEMFILELTLRSWIHSEENKRRTLQRNDIAAAITKTDIFDFLVRCSPRPRAAAEDQHPTPLPWIGHGLQ